MRNTSLSDKITALIHPASGKVIAEFHADFFRSRLGLVMNGLPELSPGESFKVGNTDNPTLKLVSDPAGKVMIKACADPDEFERNYSPGINALMTGEELLKMLLKLPDVEGILVCSASSFNSFPIYRDTAEQLLSRTNGQSTLPRRWWQFWSPKA